MSDSNDGAPPPPPYGQPPNPNPYGQAPAPNPYGQAPFGSSYPQAPAPAPYGQAPYGQPGYGSGVDPDKRPGTVTAAGIITLVFAGLTLIVSVIGAIGLLVARDEVVKEIRKEPAFDDLGNPDDVVSFLVVLVVVLAVWCVIAMVLAVLAMRRSNIARILLVVSSVVTALLSLLAITSLFSFVTLAAAVTAIVLLFVGGAGDWYARKGAQANRPVATTQPWG
ncbi:hypothetical protein [Nocardioides sp.]|uniref:hypothetical protein n=1 Tax=Nocardioides sp. TaxID=35761 RepID=UPI0031FED39A|nr:hypothetical protein [Nocardioides sp.]